MNIWNCKAIWPIFVHIFRSITCSSRSNNLQLLTKHQPEVKNNCCSWPICDGFWSTKQPNNTITVETFATVHNTCPNRGSEHISIVARTEYTYLGKKLIYCRKKRVCNRTNSLANAQARYCRYFVDALICCRVGNDLLFISHQSR